MKQFRVILLAFVLSLLFLGCEKKIDTGLHEVHWDRDMCELCKMVVSERYYAVQVVNPNKGKSYMFDDLGCAILWFKEEQITWEKDAKVYIADAVHGKFIDAKTAYYDTSSRTPMDYGFGAFTDKSLIDSSKEIIGFDEVRLRILRGETMQNPLIKQGKL